MGHAESCRSDIAVTLKYLNNQTLNDMKNLNRIVGYMLLVAAVVMFSAPAQFSFPIHVDIAVFLLGFICLFGAIELLSISMSKILGASAIIIALGASSCQSCYSGHLKEGRYYDSIVRAAEHRDSARYKVSAITMIRYNGNEYTMLPVNNVDILYLPTGYMPGDTIFDHRISRNPDDEIVHYLVVRNLVDR